MVRGMPARALEPESDDEEVHLFEAFLGGDASARESFPARLHGRLLAMANGMGAGLAPDQREEAVNEAWLMVLNGRGRAFDPRRAGLSTYLGQVMKDAIRRVRASYARPGQPTRLPSSDEQEHGDRGRVIEYSAAPRDDIHRDVEPHTDGRAGEQRAALRLAQDQIGERRLKMFSDIVIFGESVTDTAKAFGLSRFQLHREMIAVRKEMAAAM